MEGIKRLINKLDDAITKSLYYREDIKENKIKKLFGTRKKDVYAGIVETSVNQLGKDIWKITRFGNLKENREPILKSIKLAEDLEKYYSEQDLKKLLAVLNQLKATLNTIQKQEIKDGFKVSLPKLPLEIREEIVEELKEMEKCYNSGYYRSAVILCGRILEIALHRRYYNLTGTDLLEKAPGIGLGKLVSKLQEKDVKIDPGLGNQIHLINQVRVHSVHKKSEVFRPSKEQAYAIILYTLDVVKKLF